MDSTAIEAINQNTAAIQMLDGSLWFFMGFLGFMWGILTMMKYTLKGH